MRDMSSSARGAVKQEQRLRSHIFERWVFSLQHSLVGDADSGGKTVQVLCPEKRRSLVNAIVKAEGFQVAMKNSEP